MSARSHRIDKLCNSYAKEIFSIYSSRVATEPSYYHVLKKLIESLAKIEGKRVDVTIASKKKEGAMPDLLVRTNEGFIVGYIEAKDLGTNLNKVKDSKQLKKYRKSFPNLLLTNFSDFFLFRKGKQVSKTTLFNYADLGKRVLPSSKEFYDFLQVFLSFSVPRKITAHDLASELAIRTIWLKDVISEELLTNEDLVELYKIFREDLITSLTEDDFADLYAQTISYGLLFAKMQARNKPFDRTLAYSYIPKTIPLLQRVFYLLTGPNLPESIEWIVDDIIKLLSSSDLNQIRQEFHTKKWVDDPVVYFYETFLAIYDPTEHKRRGVYFTPPPIVSYIISSVHLLLQDKFSKKSGFADPSVTFLDPAAGTLTFFTTAIRLTHRELRRKHKLGAFRKLVYDHILKDFFAFELLLAPYVVGHFKANVVLNDLGYVLKDDERIQYYLTNTLEISEIQQRRILPALAKESEQATKIKERIPILVICGNPPYRMRSENKSKFIEGLMELYKEKVKDEKNIQPLSDDYLKFIRFAQWKIEQLGHGVIGFITNNSYLSGLIHRGVREELLKTFDEIYILNLHGNSIVGETTPDGRRDENVFDIRQGVSISIFVKLGKKGTNVISYSDLWGSREEKYSFLEQNNVSTTTWKKLKPKPPMFFFVKMAETFEDEYSKFISLENIFSKSTSGVKTHRDRFVVDNNERELLKRLKQFAFGDFSERQLGKMYRLKNTGTWNMLKAKEALKVNGVEEKKVRLYLYRPFDVRYVYYDPIVIDRSRPEMRKYFEIDNIGLLVMRQVFLNAPYMHFLVADKLSDMRVFKSNRGASLMYPLYLPSKDKTTRKSNIRQEFKEALEKLYGVTIDPEEVLFYIYAILHSKQYRLKFDAFLRIDFPRVPVPSNYELFRRISELGHNLVELHLFKSPLIDSTKIPYPIEGTDSVEEIDYDKENQRIYINKSQFIGNVPEQVWDYQIGGYKVLEKWLKGRKGKRLNSKEINVLLKVVSIILQTIQLSERIDRYFLDVENQTAGLIFAKKQRTMMDFWHSDQA